MSHPHKDILLTNMSHLHKDILDLIRALLVAQFRLQNHRKDGNYAAEVRVAFAEHVWVVGLHKAVDEVMCRCDMNMMRSEFSR